MKEKELAKELTVKPHYEQSEKQKCNKSVYRWEIKNMCVVREWRRETYSDRGGGQRYIGMDMSGSQRCESFSGRYEGGENDCRYGKILKMSYGPEETGIWLVAQKRVISGK